MRTLPRAGARPWRGTIAPWCCALAIIAAGLLGAAAEAQTPEIQTADIVLRGEISRADHETYREIAFTAPRGVRAIEIVFDYDRANRTVIDLGVMDPAGLRGWSGGDKNRVVIGETSATPSYRAGPIQAGRWRLLLGVPNIREGATSSYEARITFHRDDEPPFAPAPLANEARWYRGDLHAHTSHSDGACAAQSGERAPCPLARTLDAAVARGLDFIAITDHNATSQFNEMRALQPAYDRLLLLPGRELTTFQGHANIIGTMRAVSFRVTGRRSMNDALVEAGDAFVSINHPAAPGGESCMGCAWAPPVTDYALIDAVEVTNGGLAGALTQSAEGPLSGIPFWHTRLNEGHRLIAIGGSDNHDAGLAPERFSAIGKPTTVVFADNLSQAAVMAGLASGRVFIDVDGTRDRVLEFSAHAGERAAQMGGALAAPAGASITFGAGLRPIDGSLDAWRVEWIVDGAVVETAVIVSQADRLFTLRSDGGRHWVRVNLRDASGRLVLIGNPIFVNWPAAGG